MRIKLLQSLTDGVTGHKPGSVVEWPDDEDAGRLIDAGYAEPADAEESPAEEKAADAADPAKPRRGRKAKAEGA